MIWMYELIKEMHENVKKEEWNLRKLIGMLIKWWVIILDKI